METNTADMDVPDLISSSSSASELSSDDSSDEKEEIFWKLICKYENETWELNAIPWNEKIDLIFQIQLISPFIFGKDYIEKKFSKWISSTEMATNDERCSNLDELNREIVAWSSACLFITVYNKMREFTPLDLKGFIETNSDVCMRLNKYDNIKEAIDFMLAIDWFQELRKTIILKLKDVNITTAMAVIFLYAVEAFNNPELEKRFNDCFTLNLENIMGTVKSAQTYIDQHLYKEALNLYNKAISLNPFCHSFYDKRAKLYVILNNVKKAKFDKGRSAILQIFQSCTIYLDDIIKDIGLKIPFHPIVKELNKSEFKELKDNVRDVLPNNHSDTIVSCNVQDINTTIPDLVSSDSSGDDDDNDDQDKITNTEKNPTCLNECISVPSSKLKSPLSSSPANDSFKENIREASQAFLNKDTRKAITLYAEIIRNVSELKKILNIMDVFLLKYTYGCVCSQSETCEGLLQSISIFEEMLKEYPSITFPLIYYQLGNNYFKLNRFKEASNALNDGVQVIASYSSTNNYFWPETSVAIENLSAENLSIKFKELLYTCMNPPLPDAVCRYNNCAEIKKEIYYSDPDFKNFIIIKCKERCLLNYHLICWKLLKEELNKSNDKEYLGSSCHTPDCQSTLNEVIYIDNKGVILKQFSTSVKEPTSSKPKAKKSRPEKDKKKKKKKKKIIPLVTDQGNKDITCDDNVQKETDVQTPTKIKTDLPKSDVKGRSDIQDELSKQIPTDSKTTTFNSDNMKIIKKHEDFLIESQARLNRQRERKKEKRKPTKLMSLDEFLGDKKNAPQLLYNEYVQRLTKLQEYRDEIESNEDGGNNKDHLQSSDFNSLSINFSDMQSLMGVEMFPSELVTYIYEFIEKILHTHGSLHIDDPRLFEETSKIPLEIQDFICLAGGIINFLKESDKFIIIDDTISLSSEINSSNTDKNLDLEDDFEEPNRMDSLDSFEFSSKSECVESKISSEAVDITNYRTEPNVMEDVQVEYKNEDDDTQLTEIQDTSYTLTDPLPNGLSSQGVFGICDSLESLPASVLRGITNTANYSENEQEEHFDATTKKISQSRILQSTLKFLPLFSKDSKTKLLCLILRTIVNEKTLFQYNEKYDLNININALENYFCYAAKVLWNASNKKTQTDSPLEEENLREENKLLLKENEILKARLAENKLIETQILELKKEYGKLKIQLNDDSIVMQNKDAQIQRLHQAFQNFQISHEKEKEDLVTTIKKLQEEIKILQSKLVGSPAVTSKSVFVGSPAVTSKSVFVGSPAVTSKGVFVGSQAITSKGVPVVSPAVTSKVNVERSTCPKIQQDGPTFTVLPVPNNFEKLMSRLQSRFPYLTRDKLKHYVQQLRSRRQNHLTGLPLDEILAQVSSMVQVDMAEKGAVPKKMNSKSPLGFDIKQGNDNAWGSVTSSPYTWNASNSDNSNMCLICHEEMSKTEKLKLHCNHTFHSKCIREWFRHQSTCPVCRAHSLLPDEFPTLS